VHHGPRLLVLLALSAGIFVSRPALAGDVVVLQGSAGTAPEPSPTEVAATAQAELGDVAFAMGGRLADVLALESAPLWVLGASQENCTGEPVSSVAFDNLVRRASDSVDSLEFTAARAALATARAALPCLDGIVNPDTLYQVWFLEGLSAFHDGNQDEAKDAFSVATALDPTRQWSTDYAPAPQGVFLSALQEALSQQGRALGREEAVLGEVSVDGLPFDGGSPLLAGTHLVQLDDGETISGILLDLPAGDGWLALLSPAATEARVMRADPNSASFVAPRLSQSGWDDVVLVSELGVARFDVPNGRFGGPPRAPQGKRTETRVTEETPVVVAPPVDPVRAETESPARRVQPGAVAGGVLAVAGGIAAGAGFMISGLAFTEGNKLLDSTRPRSEYEAAYRQNVGGFAMGVAGAVAAGTGILVAVVSASQRDKGNSVAAQRRRALDDRRNGVFRP